MASKLTSAIRTATCDEDLDEMIKNHGGDRCTVVYFYLTWCGSCMKMNPFVENIADKNPKSLFVKVDAEKCSGSTRKNRVSKVPLFLLYNNQTRVDRVEGASPIELEAKIKRIQTELDYKRTTNAGLGQYLGTGGLGAGLGGVKMNDVSPYFDKKNCKVINDLVPTTIQGFLDGKKMISGKGAGRLLLIYSFTERMVVQSFKIKAPVHSGPRTLRFFTNVGMIEDIGTINSMTATQEVMLSEDDLSGDHSIDLRQGGFVGITALQVYIPENMTKSRRMEIDQLIIYGAPLTLTPYATTADHAAPANNRYVSKNVPNISKTLQ